MRASGYAKAAQDWYVEPGWLVDALLDAEDFTKGVNWDPCCGQGTIPQAMNRRGLSCWASDIVDRGCPGAQVADFFAMERVVDAIVCNPPFEQIEPWIERALARTKRKVAVIARLALLEGQRRRDRLWRKHPPSRVLVSSRRASMPPGGSMIEAKGGAVAYCWVVWDKSVPTGEPRLGWL